MAGLTPAAQALTVRRLPFAQQFLDGQAYVTRNLAEQGRRDVEIASVGISRQQHLRPAGGASIWHRVARGTGELQRD